MGSRDGSRDFHMNKGSRGMEEEQQQEEEMAAEQPSSPGVSLIQLKDRIESLLKFTLESAIDESPTETGLNLGLSKSYCAYLLKDNDDTSYPNPPCTGLFEGVPQHPLYKHLASALFLSISSGTFCSRTKMMPLVHEQRSLEQKESEWSKLIVDNGSNLMLKTVDFELHVQEPFFSQLKDGLKIVEGRCAVGDYKQIQPGALILFNNCLVLQVLEVHRYASFYEMLEVEGLAKVLPGVETLKEGVQVYRKFYSEEKERSNGVLAIHVTKPASQLYDLLASILAGLGYEGVARLMGLVHTPGTVQEALPPPRSSLLASFQLPHNANVKTSMLSGGARALSKHVHRSGERFWGSVVGSESDKNSHAVNVINHLISCCYWMNVHIVPPHGAVFEIRVRDGYGARWSPDGTKFIGFLEPYMEDGHTKGWNH